MKVIKKVAKAHGVSEKEVREEMQKAWTNVNKVDKKKVKN